MLGNVDSGGYYVGTLSHSDVVISILYKGEDEIKQIRTRKLMIL